MTDGSGSKAQPMAPEEFRRRHDVVQAQLVDALEAAFQLGEETTYDPDGPVPAWANLPEQLARPWRHLPDATAGRPAWSFIARAPGRPSTSSAWPPAPTTEGRVLSTRRGRSSDKLRVYRRPGTGQPGSGVRGASARWRYPGEREGGHMGAMVER